jgi:hypothetical protein
MATKNKDTWIDDVIRQHKKRKFVYLFMKYRIR